MTSSNQVHDQENPAPDCAAKFPAAGQPAAGKTAGTAPLPSRWRRLRVLFWVFFSISAFSLGGGLAMLPIMSREFVSKRHWLSNDDMVDTIALMQSLPGIISTNMAVLIGYRIAGIPGALAGTTGVTTPPFLVILIIAILFRQLAGNPLVDHVFLGIRSAICALILLTAIKLARQILRGAYEIIVAVLSFLILIFVPINALWIIIVAGLSGLAMTAFPVWRMQRQKRSRQSGSGSCK